MDVRTLIGLNVQRLRRERKFSQEELAFRSGCTRAYLSGIEAGRRNATILTLAKLARALGADVIELFVKPSRNSGEEPKAGRPDQSRAGPKLQRKSASRRKASG